MSNFIRFSNPFARAENPAPVAEPPGFREALGRWLAGAQAIVTQSMIQYEGRVETPRLVLEEGPRYVRVVRQDSVNRSAHAFIDKTTGDVLKPASWKGPAKGVRGNVFREAGSGVGPYGALYAR